LREAVTAIGTPAVLKTRRFGYDGKGQGFVRSADDAEAAWTAIAGAPAILEAFVAFDCELSVIVARGLGGATVAYDPARNIHENHILAHSIVPAGVADAVVGEATRIAERIVTRLDYVGVMGVEMFMTATGEPRVSVNELAPRVHNSGHWTLDACAVSQFEQHVRAICGWPLASTRRHHDAVMDNLLGEDAARWPALAAADTALHLYGKREMTAGRKMGHVTRLYPLGEGAAPKSPK
jgi:5-(carboxyamino)imidazole ribonucleotide synthase